MKAFPTGTIKRSSDSGSIISIPETDQGMDLRDYFAAKALQSILVNESIRAEIKGLSYLAEKNYQRYAKAAYIFADGMMEARAAESL